MDATTPEIPSLGGAVAMSFLSLGLVCLLAYVALRWLSRRGQGTRGGIIRVVARCALEPKRAVYLIETAGRCFLVGSADAGMSLLAEVDPAKLPIDERAPAGAASLRFAEILSRVMGRPAAPRATVSVTEIDEPSLSTSPAIKTPGIGELEERRWTVPLEVPATDKGGRP